MTNLQQRIIEYLDLQKEPTTQDAILLKARQVGYKDPPVRLALRGLTEVAHVGQWWNSKERTAYFKSYPQTALTKKTQTCLDRGDDW